MVRGATRGGDAEVKVLPEPQPGCQGPDRVLPGTGGDTAISSYIQEHPPAPPGQLPHGRNHLGLGQDCARLLDVQHLRY